MEIKEYRVGKVILDAIANYLVERPFKEVASLIKGLETVRPITPDEDVKDMDVKAEVVKPAEVKKAIRKSVKKTVKDVK